MDGAFDQAEEFGNPHDQEPGIPGSDGTGQIDTGIGNPGESEDVEQGGDLHSEGLSSEDQNERQHPWEVSGWKSFCPLRAPWFSLSLWWELIK